DGDVAMKYTHKLTVLSIVILFSLIASVLFPTRVLADDTTPPSPDTSDVSATQEPVAADEPVATEEPALVEASPVPAATDDPVIQESLPNEIPDLMTPVPEDETATEEPANIDV